MDPEIIRQMREWLSELNWGDMEPDDFAGVPDSKIISGVERFYAGGVEQFLADMEPVNMAQSYAAPEPPEIGMSHTEDPYTFRDPYDQHAGDTGFPEAEDALNKDRPRGMPSKSSAGINWFPGKPHGK